MVGRRVYIAKAADKQTWAAAGKIDREANRQKQTRSQQRGKQTETDGKTDR